MCPCGSSTERAKLVASFITVYELEQFDGNYKTVGHTRKKNKRKPHKCLEREFR